MQFARRALEVLVAAIGIAAATVILILTVLSVGLPGWAATQTEADAAGGLAGDLTAWGVALTLCGLVQRVVIAILLRITSSWLAVYPMVAGRRALSAIFADITAVGLFLIIAGAVLSAAVVATAG